MKRRLTCSVKYFCLGALLIFLGSVLLCGLGFTIVLPHEATRDWPVVTCHVINSTFSARICACEHRARDITDTRQCLDSYPCLHITVKYAISGTFTRQPDVDAATIPSADQSQPETHNVSRNHTITATLYRSWEDEFYKTCTLHECGDDNWNTKQVYEFQRLWGDPGHTFPCYCDPDDMVHVILKRTPLSQMLHAVLWPSVLLVTGFVIWFCLWIGCWEVDMEKWSQPSIDRSKGTKQHGRTLLVN